MVDYYDQNKKRHLKTFAKKKDAIAFQAGTRVEVGDGVHVAARDTVTVTEAGQLWLASCDAAGLERTTRDQYRQHLDFHISPFIGRRRLSEINVPFVRAFQDKLRVAQYPVDFPVARLRGKPRSADMVKRVTVSLGAILSDAQDRGLSVRNAVKEQNRNKGRQKAAARHKAPLQVGVDIPTPDEIKRILAAATGRARVFLLTAVFTGMRASELRGLRWSDIDLARAEITVRQRADAFHEIGSPKSSKGRRMIPLVTSLVKVLAEWQLECPKGDLDLVFPNGAGNVEWHANIIKRWLIPPQIAAGVTTVNGVDDNAEPVMDAKYPGLHAMRHFYASWCINRPQDGGLGLPAKIVQDRMGHSSITVTVDVYGHLFAKGDDAGAMDSAADALLVA